MTVFKRSDTRAMALSIAAFLAVGTMSMGLGMPGWPWPPLFLIAPLAGIVPAVLIVWLRRKLPADVPLRFIGADEQGRMIRTPPPKDRTLLCVTIRRSWGSRYRLEVFLDDIHLGQLRPGTGFLVPILPGSRKLTVFYGDRRNAVQESFEAVAGKAYGLICLSFVGRGVMLDLSPAAGVPLRGVSDVRLLRPLVSDI